MDRGGAAPAWREYVAALRQGSLRDRWVDIYPNQGKRQGAFSSGWKGTFPFIMMSYNDSLNSLSTLAHELGHSMHSYLTWQTQPMIYSDYSLFVAEVASNFHQAMVRAHLLATQDDPGFQTAVIEEAMYNFHRYFFQMPTLARFELEMHERTERGEGLTAGLMIDRMAALFEEGYGGEMHVDRTASVSPGRSSATCTPTSTSSNTRPGFPPPTRWPSESCPARRRRRVLCRVSQGGVVALPARRSQAGGGRYDHSGGGGVPPSKCWRDTGRLEALTA